MPGELLNLEVVVRDHRGKGASRRLRKENQIPAILYGGGQAPLPLVIDHHHFEKKLKIANFHTQLYSVSIGDETHSVLIKALQRHPYKPIITHIDLQRVTAQAKVCVLVPIVLIDAVSAPGVKQQGGVMAQRIQYVEVLCLPQAIPACIEVDTSSLHIGESIYLADVTPPVGLQFKAVTQGFNPPVASVYPTRTSQQRRNED